jgi:hypothetical protein
MTTLELNPSAAGDNTEITYRYPATGGHYDKVDDPSGTPDDNATYVRTSVSSYQLDLYNLPDQSLSGTISNVTIYARCLSFVAQGYAKIATKTESVIYYSAILSPPIDSYGDFSKSYDTNPNTGVAWTWAEINALQIGIALQSNDVNATRCTQVFAIVTYTPSAGSTRVIVI